MSFSELVKYTKYEQCSDLPEVEKPDPFKDWSEEEKLTPLTA